MDQKFEKPSSPLFQSTPKNHNFRQRTSVKDAPAGFSEQTLPFMTLNDTDEPQIEDSGIGASTLSKSLPADEPEDDCISFPLNKRIDMIGKKAQDLIERINHSRAMDQKAIADFEDTLMKKVREACQELKDHMFRQYEEQSGCMEAQLQELSEVLGRSSQLSVELQGASQTLAVINKGLQQTPEH